MSTRIGNLQCIVDQPKQSNLDQSCAVVLLHGYGADNTDLAPLSRFLDPEKKWTWIFPNAPLTVDLGMGFQGRAWFPIDVEALQRSMMTGEPREFASQNSPQFNKLIDQEMTSFVAQLQKNYDGFIMGGFSQGAMVASHLFAASGDSLLAGLLLSTVLLSKEKLESGLNDVKPKPFFQSHGQHDQVLAMKHGKQLCDCLKSYGWKGQWCEFSGGHEIPLAILEKARQFLASIN